MTRLMLTAPGLLHNSILVIGAEYVTKNQPKRLVAGFAFVTLIGARALVQNFNSPEWNKMEKRFLIGISQGISEPKAIRLLQSQSSLSLRVYVPGGKLTLPSLFDGSLFHPKVVLFEGSKKPPFNLLYIYHRLT